MERSSVAANWARVIRGPYFAISISAVDTGEFLLNNVKLRQARRNIPVHKKQKKGTFYSQNSRSI
jgi:hypothetical protein